MDLGMGASVAGKTKWGDHAGGDRILGNSAQRDVDLEDQSAWRVAIHGTSTAGVDGGPR